MNNKIFDWSRFCKVVRKDLRNMWPTFGPTLLIVVLLPLMVWLISLVFGDINSVNITPAIRTFMILLVIDLAGILAPSRMYRTSNLPKEGIHFAMLPASKLEKYFSMLFITLIVTPIVALLGSVALDMLLTALPFGGYRDWLWVNNDGWNFLNSFGGEEDYELYYMIGRYMTPGTFLLSSILSYWSTVSIFIFTTTIFKRHKVLYTILWLYVIEFVLSLASIPVFIHAVMNGSEWLMDFANKVNTPDFFAYCYWIGNGIEVLLTVGLLFWAGLRLKKMRY